MTRIEAINERIKQNERKRKKYRAKFFDPSEYGCWITGGTGSDISKNLDKYDR